MPKCIFHQISDKIGPELEILLMLQYRVTGTKCQNYQRRVIMTLHVIQRL